MPVGRGVADCAGQQLGGKIYILNEEIDFQHS